MRRMRTWLGIGLTLALVGSCSTTNSTGLARPAVDSPYRLGADDFPRALGQYADADSSAEYFEAIRAVFCAIGGGLEQSDPKSLDVLRALAQMEDQGARQTLLEFYSSLSAMGVHISHADGAEYSPGDFVALLNGAISYAYSELPDQDASSRLFRFVNSGSAGLLQTPEPVTLATALSPARSFALLASLVSIAPADQGGAAQTASKVGCGSWAQNAMLGTLFSALGGTLIALVPTAAAAVGGTTFAIVSLPVAVGLAGAGLIIYGSYLYFQNFNTGANQLTSNAGQRTSFPITGSMILRIRPAGLSGPGSVLQDVAVSSSEVVLRVWDYGAEDGDIVDIYFNSEPVAEDLSLTNTGTSFPLSLQSGQNKISIHADNEGQFSPNTAALSLSNAISGPARQSWQLKAGQTGSFAVSFN